MATVKAGLHGNLQGLSAFIAHLTCEIPAKVQQSSTAAFTGRCPQAIRCAVLTLLRSAVVLAGPERQSGLAR